jgi:hypothetical protein
MMSRGQSPGAARVVGLLQMHVDLQTNELAGLRGTLPLADEQAPVVADAEHFSSELLQDIRQQSPINHPGKMPG